MARDKVFVVGGGTGGHLFPAIAVVEALNKKKYDATLITDNRCVKYLKNHQNINTHIINVSRSGGGLLGKVFGLYFMASSLIDSLWLLYKARPNLVIGFGGYVTYPILTAARIMRIPIMLHEQNCFLGKVNRMFANASEKLCIAFDGTRNIPANLGKNKIIVTGNPVRTEILDYKPSQDTKSDKTFKILITGGSQGASFLSQIIPEAINVVQKEIKDIELSITHQSRPEDIEAIKLAFKKYKIKADVSDFFYNMPELLHDTDLLIGRAGAATIAELITASKPAILIPYPFAAERHQHFNAEMIQDSGGGWFFDQKDLTPEILSAKIISLIKDERLLSSASHRLKKLQKPSADIIMGTAEEIIRKFQEKV